MKRMFKEIIVHFKALLDGGNVEIYGKIDDENFVKNRKSLGIISVRFYNFKIFTLNTIREYFPHVMLSSVPILFIINKYKYSYSTSFLWFLCVFRCQECKW